MQQNKLAKLNYRTQALSSCISLGLGDWRRQETKDVAKTSQSTYKNVSEARELKMPAGSSVRSFSLKSLNATRNESDQVFRAWLNLTSHCPPPPLELWFQASALESGMAKLNKKKKAEFTHRAEALSSCISLDQGEETTKYQVGRERGQKKQMATGERRRRRRRKNIMVDKKPAYETLQLTRSWLSPAAWTQSTLIWQSQIAKTKAAHFCFSSFPFG